MAARHIAQGMRTMPTDEQGPRVFGSAIASEHLFRGAALHGRAPRDVLHPWVESDHDGVRGGRHAIDEVSRAIDARVPSIDYQSRAFDDEDQRIDDVCQPIALQLRAIGEERQTFDRVHRAIGDEFQAIVDDDGAFDDQFQAIDDEDRTFDSEFQAIDDGFRLISGEFAFKACLSQTNDSLFLLKLGLFVSIACVEGLKEARDRSIGAKFQTIPDLYLCFAVVDGCIVDAFPA
jgi:hypothetical protein